METFPEDATVFKGVTLLLGCLEDDEAVSSVMSPRAATFPDFTPVSNSLMNGLYRLVLEL